jgi:hypothetical protein
MNDFAHALKIAGIARPTNSKRVWQYLKDGGPRNTRAVASELKMTMDLAASYLYQLTQRKMLKRIEVMGPRGKREASMYEALGREFELLPMPKKLRDFRPAPVQVTPTLQIVTERPTTFSPESLLANCTLAEMRSVHEFLKRLFK